MSWESFKVIAASVGVIAGLIGSGTAIYKFITSWRKRIFHFFQTHGMRGEVRELKQSIEELQKAIKKNTGTLNAVRTDTDNIRSELDANTVLTLKLELKSLFRNHPECTQVIEQTMKKYKSLGGDSYIDTMYDEWKEAYEKPKMRKAIGKGDK